MGLLMDFYVGDCPRIARALQRGDEVALADPRIVAAHVDLSFHLSPGDLDELVRVGCVLAERPSMTFAEAIRDPPAPRDEQGVHALAASFRDLLAEIPPERVGALYEAWMARLPAPSIDPARRRSGRARRLRRVVETAIFGAILLPILAAQWLFSPSFRAERRRNLAAQAAASVEPTLSNALAELAAACRAARDRGQGLLYVWSL